MPSIAKSTVWPSSFFEKFESKKWQIIFQIAAHGSWFSCWEKCVHVQGVFGIEKVWSCSRRSWKQFSCITSAFENFDGLHSEWRKCIEKVFISCLGIRNDHKYVLFIYGIIQIHIRKHVLGDILREHSHIIWRQIFWGYFWPTYPWDFVKFL